jgi:hypothetical protein
MFARLRAEIRTLPVWGQPFAWVTYFCLWLAWQILLGIRWLLGELYRQVLHALQQLVRRFWWPLIFGGVGILAYLAAGPVIFGQLLLLGVMVWAMWAGLQMMWRGTFPRKKKPDHSRRHE